MKQFLKDWTLIIAILSGVAGYFAYINIPALDSTHHAVHEFVALIQPILIFVMLFLTFCRVNPRDIRLRSWHGCLLVVQCGLFIILGSILIGLPDIPARVEIEGAMICLICPTATAGAVVTRKLGGNVEDITTYIILINIAVAVVIPTMTPFVHPNSDMSVFRASMMILSKVFPLLLMPLAGALLIRRFAPRLHARFSRSADVSFYLWAVALTLAIAVTTHSIVNSSVALSTQLWLVAISLVCCLIQFWIGRHIGAGYDRKITAGQSLGQKNTVLAIWMGYTFFSPVTAVAGGFYSIWHNVINSWQLYEHKKLEERHSAGSIAENAR